MKNEYQYLIHMKWILMAIAVICFSYSAVAAEEHVLRAGLTVYEPYVIKSPTGYQGLTIDIWSSIAKNLNLKYQLVPLGENIDENVLALKNGKIDILLGPVTSTYARARMVEFTRPYALNKVGIIVPVIQVSFLSALWTFFVKIFIWMFLAWCVLVLAYTHLIWFLERGKLPSVPEGYWQGITSLIWLILLKKRGIYETPKTSPGRIVQFVWLTLGTIIISLIYAAMINSFHSSFGNPVGFDTKDAMTNKRIVAIAGNVGYTFAKEAGIFVTPVKDRKSAMNLLLEQKVDGFVDSTEDASVYIEQHGLGNRLAFSPFTFKVSIMAFALPNGALLIPQIDRELALLQDKGMTMAICKKYMNPDDALTYCL